MQPAASSSPCSQQPVLQADTTQTQPHQISNTQRTENKTTDVVIQQHSRKLLMMGILMSETCWVHTKKNKIARDIKLVFYSSAIFRIFGQHGQCCGQLLNHEYPELYHMPYCWDSFKVKCCTLDCYQRTVNNTYITTELIRMWNPEHSSMKTTYTKMSPALGKKSHLWEEQKFKIKPIQNTELYYFRWLWITVQVFELLYKFLNFTKLNKLQRTHNRENSMKQIPQNFVNLIITI